MSEPVSREIAARISPAAGISPRAALQLEYGIIALGVLALALIFQPFSLSLFAVGCGLVVLTGLINNLLPLCLPGVPLRSVAIAALIVADIFCGMLLVAITAAYLYGIFFVNATAPDTASPFYLQPFVWGVAAVAALLAFAIWKLRA